MGIEVGSRIIISPEIVLEVDQPGSVVYQGEQTLKGKNGLIDCQAFIAVKFIVLGIMGEIDIVELKPPLDPELSVKKLNISRGFTQHQEAHEKERKA
jgi:hypothetical protein